MDKMGTSARKKMMKSGMSLRAPKRGAGKEFGKAKAYTNFGLRRGKK